MQTKIQELTIEGVTYVPKDSIQKSYEGEIKIVILQRGWVYVGRFSRDGNLCKLTNAKNIRTWGTTKGLPELVNGVTSKTVLDPCEGIVEFDWLTVIHTINVNQEKWKGFRSYRKKDYPPCNRIYLCSKKGFDKNLL